jgi:hypothetical protein
VRRGTTFGYDIPVENGTHTVRLGFVEPDRTTAVGDRVFDVSAEGQTRIADLDILAESGTYRTIIEPKTFTVTVMDGTLDLDFTATAGEAVVANITVGGA